MSPPTQCAEIQQSARKRRSKTKPDPMFLFKLKALLEAVPEVLRYSSVNLVVVDVANVIRTSLTSAEIDAKDPYECRVLMCIVKLLYDAGYAVQCYAREGWRKYTDDETSLIRIRERWVLDALHDSYLLHYISGGDEADDRFIMEKVFQRNCLYLSNDRFEKHFTKDVDGSRLYDFISYRQIQFSVTPPRRVVKVHDDTEACGNRLSWHMPEIAFYEGILASIRKFAPLHVLRELDEPEDATTTSDDASDQDSI